MSDTESNTFDVEVTSLGVDGYWIGPPLVLPLRNAETARIITDVIRTLLFGMNKLQTRVFFLALSREISSPVALTWLTNGDWLRLLGSALNSMERFSDGEG